MPKLNRAEQRNSLDTTIAADFIADFAAFQHPPTEPEKLAQLVNARRFADGKPADLQHNNANLLLLVEVMKNYLFEQIEEPIAKDPIYSSLLLMGCLAQNGSVLHPFTHRWLKLRELKQDIMFAEYHNRCIKHDWPLPEVPSSLLGSKRYGSPPMGWSRMQRIVESMMEEIRIVGDFEKGVDIDSMDTGGAGISKRNASRNLFTHVTSNLQYTIQWD